MTMDTDSVGVQGISFQFVVYRGQSATQGDLGLDLCMFPDTKDYRVADIKPGGLVAQKNDQLRQLRNREVANRQLIVNDTIQAVNGKTDHKEVCKELHNAMAIHMAVMRQGAAVSGNCLPCANKVVLSDTTSATAPLASEADATDIETQYAALDGFQPGMSHSLQTASLEEEHVDGIYTGVVNTGVTGTSPIPEPVIANVAVDWNSVRMALVIQDYNPENFEPEIGYLAVARGDRVRLLTDLPGSVAAGTEGKEKFPEYVYSEFQSSGSGDGDKKQGWLPTAILHPQDV